MHNLPVCGDRINEYLVDYLHRRTFCYYLCSLSAQIDVIDGSCFIAH